jgi:subtilisin family serine protease
LPPAPALTWLSSTPARTPAGDSYASYNGTSMAAPHVTGVVALMLSKCPALTPGQVEVKLKARTRFPGRVCGLRRRHRRRHRGPRCQHHAATVHRPAGP